MSEQFARRYWRTVKKCCCPWWYQEEEEELPLIGKVWNNYFAPAPEPVWNQLPKSVQEAEKKTSIELQRYASSRKSGIPNPQFDHNELTDTIGKNATAITDAVKEKLGGLLYGNEKKEEE